jgi:hypothetical protein
MLRSMMLVLFVFLAGGPLLAEDLPAEVGAARSIIADQLAAFARDDGEAAYGFASPEIKAKFPTPEIFMSMVRKGYGPVYRPQSYDFSTSEVLGNGIVRQEVDIIDSGGEAWTAEYLLRPEPDGGLKIIACRLVKKPGVGA